MRLRSAHDREILGLALPALGALAAEPLYILVDTAIVGHLGRSQLAALGAAATVLSVFALFNFLQYGTTAQVARATGAGENETASRVGAQALWLSAVFGLALAAAVALFAPAIVELVGVDGQTAEYAVTYLRIVVIGLPSAFLALGGQGYLRGIADLRTPLILVAAGNVLNLILEVWFVYGLDWGIEGSAAGTAIAQTAMGIGFLAVVVRRVTPSLAGIRPAIARRLLSLGGYIFLRTAALMSAFILAGAVIARSGDAPLAAYQICFQLWIFLALVLDALAIAGQIIVGRELGARRPTVAYDTGGRLVVLAAALGGCFTIGLLLVGDVLPRVFTGDASVLAEVAIAWTIFALMQPLNGAVFALDGILIGAGDGPFIARSMAVAFLGCAAVLVATLTQEWGTRGVWVALVVLLAIRFVTMGIRFRRRGWLVTGWA